MPLFQSVKLRIRLDQPTSQSMNGMIGHDALQAPTITKAEAEKEKQMRNNVTVKVSAVRCCLVGPAYIRHADHR